MTTSSKKVAVKTTVQSAPLTDLQYMRQALRNITPLPEPVSHTSFMEGLAIGVGAMPSAALTFRDTVRDSYRYHEAVRKGQL